MAKLRCDKHDRRVFALKGKFLHRGWGEICDSPTATIGKKTFTASEIEDKPSSTRRRR